MTPPEPPRPRKRPRQSRSTLLVESIHQACQQILEREGSERLTTQRIAEVAGINIASLYQYFPNKEAVLADIFEQQVSSYVERARERFERIERLSQSSLEGTLREIIDMEIEQHLMLHRMNPDFYRAYQQSFDVHRRLEELTISLENPSWSTWFPRFLSHHRRHLRHVDPETLSRLCRYALSGTLRSALAENPGQLEQAEFRDELLQLLLRYLHRS